MDRLKKLLEQKNELLDKIRILKEQAKVREITKEEDEDIDRLMEEVRGIERTIKHLDNEEKREVKTEIDKFDISDELRRFLLNPTLELSRRAYGSGAGNKFALADAGQGQVIMPKTMSDKIIEKVMAESDILPLVTKYYLTGTLTFPKFDNSSLAVAFYDEGAETVESNGKFSSITLTTHRVSGLIRITRQLINNVNFDIESFLIAQIVKIFKEFLEKIVCQGANNKVDSIFNATDDKTIELAKKDAWDIDALIDVKIKLHSNYSRNAVFLMHPEVLQAIRKLKDNNGRYYVLDDVIKGYGFTVLRTAIKVSDFAPKDKILYGDLSCYALSCSSKMKIQPLYEKYATTDEVGVYIRGEYGGRILDDQGLAIIKNKDAAVSTKVD